MYIMVWMIIMVLTIIMKLTININCAHYCQHVPNTNIHDDMVTTINVVLTYIMVWMIIMVLTIIMKLTVNMFPIPTLTYPMTW